MNGGDKDKYGFGSFPFGDSFKDMSDEINLINRFMETLFKDLEIPDFPPHNNAGNLPPGNIPRGFPPMMNIPGDSPPLDPRAQMLKDDGDDDGNNKLIKRSQEKSPVSDGERRPFSGFMSPGDRLSPTSDGSPFFMSRMKGVHTVRHGDGTVERTETVQQDGQICKTVTITDPNGKSTSTTSCERSDGPRQFLPSSPFLMAPHSGMDQGLPSTDVSKIEAPSGDSGLNKDDASFFGKLFGGFWSKPKS